MKKLLLFCCATLLLLFTGCNSSKLTAGKAKQIITQELADQRTDCKISEITLGYYEENNAKVRYQLRKLAAAGVLEYEATRILVNQNIRSGYNWYGGGYTYRSVQKPHYFVKIALTPAGEKYLTEMKPALVDEDLENTPSEEVYPEDNVPEEETFAGNAAPASPQAETPEEPQVETQAENMPTDAATATATNTSTESEYQIALKNVNAVTKIVLEGRLKVAKVRNIRVYPEQQIATCQAIFKYDDVTPFGRILSGMHEGERMATKINLVYYQDKGWTVSE
ncbi:MAG: hypothetical protein RSB23_07185 [Alistipes sp.]